MYCPLGSSRPTLAPPGYYTILGLPIEGEHRLNQGGDGNGVHGDRVSCDIHHLRPASWYIFRACCHSWAGWSTWGGSSQPIQTKFDKPEPPSLPRLVRDGVTTNYF